MRILFDHGTPSGIRRSLAGHEVIEAIERGWDRVSNGELLTKAEAEGFELLLTSAAIRQLTKRVNKWHIDPIHGLWNGKNIAIRALKLSPSPVRSP